MHTTIISGFPGIGKTRYYEWAVKHGFKTLDSDSSKFSWLSPGIRNPKFPASYIAHIQEEIDKQDIILVSSHKEIRNALFVNGIAFFLAYPHKDRKQEFVANYEARGSTEAFVKLIGDNWDAWLDDIQRQQGCEHWPLIANHFLLHWLEPFNNNLRNKNDK